MSKAVERANSMSRLPVEQRLSCIAFPFLGELAQHFMGLSLRHAAPNMLVWANLHGFWIPAVGLLLGSLFFLPPFSLSLSRSLSFSLSLYLTCILSPSSWPLQLILSESTSNLRVRFFDE